MALLFPRCLRNQSAQRRLLCFAGIAVGGATGLVCSDSYMSLHCYRWPSVNISRTNCAPSRIAQQPLDRKPRESTKVLPRPPKLEGKVAIVTGASRGLGQAIAIRFVQEGSKVVLLDIADCDETMAALAACAGADKVEQIALAIRCDISNEREVIESLNKGSAYFGPKFDILVNNACAFVFRSVEDATIEDWTTSMSINILGHALVTKHCLPYMKHAMGKQAGHGPSIIFQGSISSFRAQPGCATYATMKGAIVQLARNCAYDLAKYNIRVNSICPGTIETPISAMERKDHGWTYDEWEALKTQDVFLGRVGTPLEVANAALFYASDDSTYCSGSHLMIDGGAAACTIMQKQLVETPST